MNYRWRFVTLFRRQGSRPSPWKKMQKSKISVWGGLKIAVKRREEKSKGEKKKKKKKKKDISI